MLGNATLLFHQQFEFREPRVSERTAERRVGANVFGIGATRSFTAEP
jgi:hypothetical protein